MTHGAAAAVLVADGVHVAYGGRPVLDVASLAVQEGEVLAVIGPNGAGKSTLLRVLALLEAPARGTVAFRGVVPGSARARLALRRRMASVFQEPLLCDGSVAANVRLPLGFRGVERAEADRRARPWLERLGIASLADRPARTLSGGEAQRASLARAFAVDPEVLFLDEPFAALDPPTREALLDDLGRVLGDARTTTLFVTHDRAEALRLGDRVAVVLDGRVAQVGMPAEVFGAPADEAVARLVGVENLLPGRVLGGEDGLLTVETAHLRIRVPGEQAAGRSVLVCVRPEDVVLRPGAAGPVRDSALNRFAGRVAELVPVGTQVRVLAECGHALVALVTRHSVQELPLAVGSAVTVSFKASAVHLIEREEGPSP
jgi:tungstate transport system ATP-binding protein